MSARNDGGPAFPVGDGHGHRLQGMSLRDYFAAAALQGLVACPASVGKIDEFAECAYDYADEMLAERARREAQP